MKPKGMYAVMNHQGSYESMPETYSIMKEDIEREGLRVCGHVYALDLLSYFAESNPDEYLIKIYVQVCKTDNASKGQNNLI